MLESEKNKIRRLIESGKIYLESRYKAWRKRIFKRDGYQCQFSDCKRPYSALNAHHIRMKWYFPELIYKARNGITLCEYHHKYIHRQGSDKYIERFEKITEENGKKGRIIRKKKITKKKKAKKKVRRSGATSKKTRKKIRRKKV